MLGDVVAGAVPVAADRRLVGDRPRRVPHPRGDPAPPGRLQHPRLAAVRDQIRVVVGALGGRRPRHAGAPLPVTLEQGGHHLQRLGGGTAALEPEAEQLHAEDAGLGRVAGPGARLAWARSRVNSASLPIATPRSLSPSSCPQHQYGEAPTCASVSRRRRSRRRPGAGGRRATAPRRHVAQRLRLVDRPVAVLPEQHRAVGRRRRRTTKLSQLHGRSSARVMASSARSGPSDDPELRRRILLCGARRPQQQRPPGLATVARRPHPPRAPPARRDVVRVRAFPVRRPCRRLSSHPCSGSA